MTNRMPEKFTWTPERPKVEKLPPAFAVEHELHYAPDYGPHICQACNGAGWMRDTVTIGLLVKCESCGTVSRQQLNRTLGRCWEMSGLNPNDPAAPTLVGYEMVDPAARAVSVAARRFAALPKGWLTIYGTRGSGKTHIGEAIARTLLGRQEPCLYITSPKLWEYCGAVKRTDNDDADYAGRRRWVAELPVLIVDELNLERNTEAVAEYRQEVLNTRYTAAERGVGGATVLLSMFAPDTWHEPALASRAQDSKFTCLEAPAGDYRKTKGR
jgi:hypothetical protein